MPRLLTRLLLGLCLAALLLPFPLHAQTDTQSYRSDVLGVTFQYPKGWALREQLAAQTVLAAPEGDIEGLAEGKAPSGVLFSLTLSTLRQMGARNTDDFPALLLKYTLNAEGTPQPTRIGGATGIQLIQLDEKQDLAIQTAILSIGKRRVAILRAVSTLAVWRADGEAQLGRLLESLSFFPPPEGTDVDTIGIPLWQLAADAMPDLTGLSVSNDGALIYAVDAQRGIWQINANGTAQESPLTFPQVGSYGRLITRPDNSQYLADPANHIVWRRAPNTNSVARFFGGTLGAGRGAFGEGMPRQFLFSGRNVYAVDENTNGVRVQVFAAGGAVMTFWDMARELPEAQNVLLGADSSGNLYLLAEGSNGLLKLDASGRVLARGIGAAWLADSQPLALAVDRFDNFFVATADSGILQFSPSGELVGVIGEPYDESAPPKAGQLARPVALALAPSANLLYVADVGKYPQVVAFALDGNISENLAAASAAAGEIAYAEVRRGALSDQTFLYTYIFTGKAGDVVTITLRAEGFDAYLDLLQPDGKVIAFNDDVGANTADLAPTDAQITAFSLPRNGVYTIRVTRFGRETARGAVGDYELRLSVGQP
ncbi:MAG: hypothetical protein DYG88_14495 [Chloroflexi bacterium CFX4]|nr:hypothetical protein [Chloroflexi bacterium CFX4]MDL1923815.1 hypothetical protein [Chloroflexi bacterium CFX3]